MEIVRAAAIPMQAPDVCAYMPMADHGHEPGQPPPAAATIDFAAAVRRRLAERGQSQYRAAPNSGLPQDAIRSVLNGLVSRLSHVEQIWHVTGLELFIGPPRDVQVEADGANRPAL